MCCARSTGRGEPVRNAAHSLSRKSARHPQRRMGSFFSNKRPPTPPSLPAAASSTRATRKNRHPHSPSDSNGMMLGKRVRLTADHAPTHTMALRSATRAHAAVDPSSSTSPPEADLPLTFTPKHHHLSKTEVPLSIESQTAARARLVPNDAHPWLRVPPELVAMICAYLDVRDLRRLREAARFFRDALDNDDWIWHRFVRLPFARDLPALPEGVESSLGELSRRR